MSDYMTPERVAEVRAAGYILQRICHEMSVSCGWYHDPVTGEKLDRNDGEQMMLIVSEIAEAMEACRKGLQDDKLPHRSGVEVEMADAVIRIADFCGKHGFDLGGAIAEKLAFNGKREDHKPENRAKVGGKRF